HDAAGEHQFLDVAQAQRETVIQPHRVPDDLDRIPVALVPRRNRHKRPILAAPHQVNNLTMPAGALSMAAGEYVSMRSQREAYQREITLEEQELRDDPEAEAEELALIYRAKGLDAEEAERVATTIMKDREAALDTMAREELGLDPDELGSSWSAALSSLGAFAAGAVVVVLPYLFSSGPAALIAAIVLASLALFAVGRRSVSSTAAAASDRGYDSC